MSRAVAIALLVAGCVSEPDYSMTHFMCDSTHACPGDQLCKAGVCGGSAVGPGPFVISLDSDNAVSLEITQLSMAEQASLQLATTSTPQAWSIQPIDGVNYGAGYHIVSVSSDLCLDLDDMGNANGLHMQQIRCQLDTNLTQIFQFLPTASSYQIQNAYTGRCIDSGPDLSDGALPEQWDCNGGYVHQFWDLTPIDP